MSGLLGIIGGLVTIIASIYTLNPYGIAAGALMIAGGAAQSGILGKGAQRFENSSIGKDLTMAVGLASAAISVASLASAPAAGAESSTVASANSAAEGTAATGTEADAAAGAAGSTTPADAAASAASPVGGASSADVAAVSGDGTNVPAATVSATSNEAVTNPYAMTQSFQSDPGVIDPSLNPATIDANNQLANGQALSGGTNGPGGPPVDGNSAEQLKQNLNLGSTPSQAESAATQADQSAVKPVTGGVPAGDPGEAELQAASGSTNAAPAPASQGGPMSFGQKLASGAKDALSSPGGMIMAGQAVSGWAQGKAAENINQRNLAAAQWGNTQWEDPKQVAQLDAAAAAPIGVPAGYLARAAALRSLTSGATNQTTPLQNTPPAPAAPALAGPGAGLATGTPAGGGPVPITGINATPRGGVI